MSTPVDPIVKEYLAKEFSKDIGIIPYSNTRRIVRKVYRIGKAAFLGVPILGLAISDLVKEIAICGTKEMTRKVSFAPVVALLPAPVVATGIAVYKVARKDSIRQTAACITNIIGLIYTFPCYALDHSMLYFVEKAVFGAPVPIMPEGRLRIIPNETDYEDGLRDLLDTYVKEVSGKD